MTGQPATQCVYQWSVGPLGRRYVDKYVRCHNKTNHPSGACHLHRDSMGNVSSGRFDRRPR